MSVLLVKDMNHGFGDRAIFEDVSFRLLKGEHVGLIGANGEGKSTFMNIVTGKLQPDEGKVTWSNNVRVGYMDQHAALTKGQSIREALGQILEYAHYPQKNNADKLFIVGLGKPTTKDKEYMDFLRQAYNLPVWYRWYDEKKDILSDVY